MKKILFIFFLFSFHNLFSQQVIEKCVDENLTYTYSSESSLGGMVYQDGLFCPSDTVYFTVTLLECPTSSMWAPNSFTPNGDKDNNIWCPVGYNYFKEHFFIVNRWGEIIFESYDLNNGWNGTYMGNLCQQDVYVYVLEWYSIDNRYFRKYGHITLLR